MSDQNIGPSGLKSLSYAHIGCHNYLLSISVFFSLMLSWPINTDKSNPFQLGFDILTSDDIWFPLITQQPSIISNQQGQGKLTTRPWRVEVPSNQTLPFIWCPLLTSGHWQGGGKAVAGRGLASFSCQLRPGKCSGLASRPVTWAAQTTSGQPPPLSSALLCLVQRGQRSAAGRPPCQTLASQLGVGVLGGRGCWKAGVGGNWAAAAAFPHQPPPTPALAQPRTQPPPPLTQLDKAGPNLFGRLRPVLSPRILLKPLLKVELFDKTLTAASLPAESLTKPSAHQEFPNIKKSAYFLANVRPE